MSPMVAVWNDLETLSQAAAEFFAAGPYRFDLKLPGLGENDHTTSLFP